MDPILSRSLMLAGFGLALLALGRALAATRPPRWRLPLWPIRHVVPNHIFIPGEAGGFLPSTDSA